MPMQNYTLNSYLTDYQFNPNATDDEIMKVANEGEKLGTKIYNRTIEYIIRFSESLEYNRSENFSLSYNLN